MTSPSSQWGTTLFLCPKCKEGFSVTDLDDTPPLSCPRCGAIFNVQYKYHWVHISLSIACGWAVAYLQGLHSIVFGGAWLVYSAVCLIVIELLGFPLKLPKRFALRTPDVQSLNLDSHDH
jgi:uncharacterized C2H2 Zn-finger protein